MTKSIGIPRGLLFYNFFPLWSSFFESLGMEVVTTSETNKGI
ncbi:MAG: acyl-CoA dehydratase activase-related protein, partial [Bacillota bacterium]